MEWIVTTGKTVAEAVEAALDELGVDEADIEYEVLEESKRGFLSRLGGGSPARIKARVKPLSREKPDRRRRGGGRERDRERRSGVDGGERAARPRVERAAGDRPGGDRAAADRSGGRPGRGRPAAGPADAGAPAEEVEDRPAGERDVAAAGAAAGGAGERPSGSSSRNRRRRKKPQGASATARASAAEAGSNVEEEEAVSGSDVSLEEQAELAEAFTRGLVERFGLPATVAARSEGDDDVMVDIQGTDLGLLIGPRAATVDAIQELVRTAVQRRIGGHGARIHVDVAGYRARRQEALAEFARQAAQRALESGRDQVFEPMSPVDRKIVHDIVNEIEGVSTISEGEEPRRRVVIKALANSS
ncbi:MAG: RNA-binding cell elongation regulator Jag/EloR [Actinomycetota bacterium]|jgi:spoIIIJ-associated protein